MNYSQFSEHVISECARRAPCEFVREMFPRFARFDKRVPKEWLAGPSSFGNPDDQLRDALAGAMISLGQADPAELDLIVDAETLSETKWMHSLLLRAWSSNPDHYSEHIVRYLLASPDQRLDIGYDIAAGGSDIFVAVSRTAVAAASSLCSDASFIDLENAILNVAPVGELEKEREGLTELMLLRALAPERLGEVARQRIQELERRYPNVSQQGAPQPLTRMRAAQRVKAPISEEAQQAMSDDQWLSAMATHIDEEPIFVGEQVVGGAEELSRGLKKLAAKYPDRFSTLVGRMEATLLPSYFEAILNGITETQDESARPGLINDN